MACANVEMCSSIQLQISLIRSETAHNLGLKGRDISVNITKVGGELEKINTKVYKVPVTAIDNLKRHSVRAIGIPCISVEIARIHVAYIVERFGLSNKKVWRGKGPVDLLIGIDHPNMHTGLTKQMDHLVARKSPLGWVFFGSSPGALSAGDVTRVLHVKYQIPVSLTDFWTTETMGVEVKPCTCGFDKLSQIEREEKALIEESAKKVGDQWMIPYPWEKDPKSLPDNKYQAVKRLELMERPLVKKPDQATAYDNQMKEMETLKFARKLSKEEMENYKGPVHYISHHAVVGPKKKYSSSYRI